VLAYAEGKVTAVKTDLTWVHSENEENVWALYP